MPTRTALSAFNARLDSILQGIDASDLADTDRDLCIREAIVQYGKDMPRRCVAELPGAGHSYLLLFGRVVDIDPATQDASIDLTNAAAGAGKELAVRFTLDRDFVIHEIWFRLQRIGATVAGNVLAKLYTDGASLPVTAIASSGLLDIDDDGGAPQGRMDWVKVVFDPGVALPAGSYHAALAADSGYVYASGSNEVDLGVDQSAVTANVSTLNGGTGLWSAYAPASAGVLVMVAGIEGWTSTLGQVESVEYPAADIASDEAPNLLEDDQFETFRSQSSTWLRLVNHQPASTETVRVSFGRPYEWVEATDPVIDTPPEHFEAVNHLAAALACERLATRYGQKRTPTISADVADRRTQGDFYKALAADHRRTYKAMIGLGAEEEAPPGMTIIDLDETLPTGGDYLFHRKASR